jgi:hypothetical protein
MNEISEANTLTERCAICNKKIEYDLREKKSKLCERHLDWTIKVFNLAAVENKVQEANERF